MSTDRLTLLSGATATGAGLAVRGVSTAMTFQAVGATTSGAGAATIAIQVSDGGGSWITIGTISLTLSTTSSTDGIAVNAPWAEVRANVTAISGTGASVNVYMGV